jgi:ribosomal protein S18 acetylase RimI-like enzyme
MLLRLAEANDVPDIYAVMLECLPTYDSSYCMPNEKSFFVDMIKRDGVVIIAEEVGKLVGYAVLDLNLGTERGNLLKLGIDEEDYMLTMNLEVCMVLPGYRRQGIQKLFIGEALKIAKTKNYKHIYSTTHPDNRASLTNLLKAGFKKVLLSHNSRKEPRLLMHKDID